MSAKPSDSDIVNEPPDDDVAIGESPDGDTIGGGQARRLVLNRRDLLKAAGTLAVFAAIAEGEFGSSTGGTLRGGTMALDKAYKISDRAYLGPDSVKDGVISSIPETEGWLYHASDTDVTYYLDNNAWQLRNIGSSGNRPDAFLGPLDTDQAGTNIVVPPATHYAFKESGTTKIVDDQGVVQESESFAGDAFSSFISNQGSNPFHLRIGEGTFSVNYFDIDIGNGAQWVSGIGREVTILQVDSATPDNSDDAVRFNGAGATIEFNGLLNLTVDGNQRNTGHTGTSENVNIQQTKHMLIQNVRTRDAPSDGADMDNDQYTNLRGVVAEDNGKDGIKFSTGSQDGTVVQSRSLNNGRDGFGQRNGADDNTFVACRAEGNTTRNWHISDDSGASGAVVAACRSVNGGVGDTFAGAAIVQIDDAPSKQDHVGILTIDDRAGSAGSTSFTTLADLVGVVDTTYLPTNAVLQGRMVFRSGSTVDQDCTVRAKIYDPINNNATAINDLDTVVTSGDTVAGQDSGWTNLPGAFQDTLFIGTTLDAKLNSAGNSSDPVRLSEFGIMFRWVMQ